MPTLFGLAREEGHVFRDYTKLWAGQYLIGKAPGQAAHTEAEVRATNGTWKHPPRVSLSGVHASDEEVAERYSKIDRMLPWDLNLPLGSPERTAVAREIYQLYFDNTETPTRHQYYEVDK